MAKPTLQMNLNKELFSMYLIILMNLNFLLLNVLTLLTVLFING